MTQRKGPITRESILSTIDHELQMVEQWKEMEVWHSTTAHYNRAEALIELLEVSDCGSSGGHARGQTDAHRCDLRVRLSWLKKVKT